MEEIERDVKKPVVKELLNLIKFRNECPAFDGDFEIIETKNSQLIHIKWQKTESYAELKLDLSLFKYEIFSNHELKTASLK